jgi:hypothetical protein
MIGIGGLLVIKNIILLSDLQTQISGRMGVKKNPQIYTLDSFVVVDPHPSYPIICLTLLTPSFVLFPI